MKMLVTASILLFSPLAYGQDQESADPLVRRTQCTAIDNANQTFKATRKRRANAERAALNLCTRANGVNCRIQACVLVNGFDSGDLPPPGAVANCVVNLDTTTQGQQVFANFNDAEQVCIDALNAVNDENATCTVRQKNANGQRRFFPDFQIHEQIDASGSVDAINQMQRFFQQGANLLADKALQTVLTNNGNCK